MNAMSHRDSKGCGPSVAPSPSLAAAFSGFPVTCLLLLQDLSCDETPRTLDNDGRNRTVQRHLIHHETCSILYSILYTTTDVVSLGICATKCPLAPTTICITLVFLGQGNHGIVTSSTIGTAKSRSGAI